MPDSKAKRGKQDRARVSLGQEHEREYLEREMGDALYYADCVLRELGKIKTQIEVIRMSAQRARIRLRAGFPAAQKKARRGK